MKKLENMMGLEWNNKDVWDSYINELEGLYSAMDRYIKHVAHLKSLNGVDITYGSARTDAFFNIQTVEEWSRFMRDVYGIEVIKLREESQNSYQESTRIFWDGDTQYEENEISCENSFYCIINMVYEMLSASGFKSQVEDSEFPNQDNLVMTAENLFREIINFSPLVNPQTFFLLSLRYVPHSYALSKYGDMGKVEELMGWKRISSWTTIPTGWQIHSFTDPFWSRVADSLHLLYGFCQKSPYWNASLEMWSIIGRYIGENLHERYFKNAKRAVMESYGKDPEISGYIEGSEIPSDILFTEIDIKSLLDFEFVSLVVEDSLDTPEFPLRYDNVIRFIAPQMFLNIGSMYLNDDSRWTFGFYLPEQMIHRAIPKDFKLQAPDVNPMFIDKRSVIPPEWKMHSLRNVLENIEFHLEYLASMTEEYEDFEG